MQWAIDTFDASKLYAAPRTLERMLPRLRRREEGPDPRVALIRSAKPLVTDPALILAGELEIKCLAAQILQLNPAIAEHEQQLQKLMAQHPDALLFSSLPGAGDALSPRLLAAFGTDRDRHASAEEMQQYSGIAPVTKRSGKTRLALEAARALDAELAGAVWFVDLAPLGDPALVDAELAATLGVAEQVSQPLIEAVADALRGRQALLVLDNCEHLVDACAAAAEALLRAAPSLRILATSRETLRVPGETVSPVPPLPIESENV